MKTACSIKNGSLSTFVIKVNDTIIPDENRVFSIEVEKAINRIAKAKITLRDGEPDTGTFKASSSSTFVPGGKITIEAGYDNQNQPIFKGIITGQTIKVNDEIGSGLVVECRDEAVKMIVGRKSLTYSQKKDSAVIESIISNYSGIKASVTPTEIEWPELVQYYATDWDFVLSRAEVNGLIVIVNNGEVDVIKPGADTSSVLIITYGDNLMGLDADLNAITQLKEAKATGWDYKTQELSSGSALNDHKGPGNLSSEELAGVIGLSAYDLQTTAPLNESDLMNWSKGQLIKSEYAKIRGTLKFQGSALVNPGKYVTLKGCGDRFNGNHLIDGVYHNISDGNWITDITVGLSPIWFTQEPDVMSPPAAGLLPGVQGLFNGTVKQIYEDPDEQYRVLVDVPLFDKNGAGLWARLTNFYATSGAGSFFFPEIGDEVVLGFLNEDPRYPIILGSLYSSTKHKPYDGLEPNEKNSIKAIVSKSGIAIEFNDETKVLSLTTPEKNTLVLSDEDKQIMLKDQNGNSIELSESGITIKSEKSITIEADESIDIKGSMGVKITADSGDVETNGLNIKQSADAEFSAEGSASAQINGGAETTIKGALVMIN